MASVEMPVVVRMGGAPDRARAWYARKMKPNVSMRNSFGRPTVVLDAAGMDAAIIA
jgi:hypothetical protein